MDLGCEIHYASPQTMFRSFGFEWLRALSKCCIYGLAVSNRCCKLFAQGISAQLLLSSLHGQQSQRDIIVHRLPRISYLEKHCFVTCELHGFAWAKNRLDASAWLAVGPDAHRLHALLQPRSLLVSHRIYFEFFV